MNPCEDAPCCGCCDPRESGWYDDGPVVEMSKSDWIDVMMRDDYDEDFGFDY